MMFTLLDYRGHAHVDVGGTNPVVRIIIGSSETLRNDPRGK